MAGAGNDRDERIQELWGGYGHLLRRRAPDGGVEIVKDVRWGAGAADRSDARKRRSYQIEARWYSRWAADVPSTCRIPACLGVQERGDGMTLRLEDLDAAGYRRRASRLSAADLDGAVRWLGRFHAAFLGRAPEGLWKEGSYWHLATRSDELAAMPPGPLRSAAADLDLRLRDCRFRAIVHGDAKPDNFCLGRPGEVAVVDFQYAGGGCGMRDLAYLLDCQSDDAPDEAATPRILDAYFAALRSGLSPGNEPLADAIEAEWRALLPVAWLDFQRFLQGWHPAYARPSRRLARRIDAELERIGAPPTKPRPTPPPILDG